MTSQLTAALLALAMLVVSANGARAQSQNELIEKRVLPHLEYLFQKLIAEKREAVHDFVDVEVSVAAL